MRGRLPRAADGREPRRDERNRITDEGWVASKVEHENEGNQTHTGLPGRRRSHAPNGVHRALAFIDGLDFRKAVRNESLAFEAVSLYEKKTRQSREASSQFLTLG